MQSSNIVNIEEINDLNIKLINIVNKALDDAFDLASDVHPEFILK